MDIRRVDPADVGTVGAEIVAGWLGDVGRSDATLMPALGESALPVYRELARRAGDVGPDARRLDVRSLRLVQLDEYRVAANDPRALIGWLRRAVAEPLGVDDDRIIRLNGTDPDADAACATYDAEVAKAGRIDVAILGLGPNGHLGFNEPPSSADAPTRCVTLTAASLESNARYWPGREVPSEALTAGMTTILGARRILLVVTGTGKRSILRRTLAEPIGPDLPAGYLRRTPNSLLLVDRDALPGDLPMSS